MNKIRLPGILLLCFCSFLLGGCTQKGGDVSGTAAAAAGPQYEWGTVSGRTLTVWGAGDGFEPYLHETGVPKI